MLKRLLILSLVFSLTVHVPPAQADNEGFEITKIAQELGLDFTSPLVIAALSTLVLWFGVNTIKGHFLGRSTRDRARTEIESNTTSVAVNDALGKLVDRMVKDKEQVPAEITAVKQAIAADNAAKAKHNKNLNSCVSGWARLGPYGYGLLAAGAGGFGLWGVNQMAKQSNKTLKQLEHEKTAKEISAPLDEMAITKKLKQSEDLFAYVEPAVAPLTKAIGENMGALRGNLMQPAVLKARGASADDHLKNVNSALENANNPVMVEASLRYAVESTVESFRQPNETPAEAFLRLTKTEKAGAPLADKFKTAVTEKFVLGLFPGLITTSSQYETFFKEATRKRLADTVETHLRKADAAAGTAKK